MLVDFGAVENSENRLRNDYFFVGTDDAHLGAARIGRNDRIAGCVAGLIELDAEKTQTFADARTYDG